MLNPSANRSSPSRASEIISTAVRILEAAPAGELPLIAIVKEIETQTGAGRPDIYGAIRLSKELETVAVEGTAMKICFLRGAAPAEFPQIRRILNSHWRSECRRGVAMLTVDEVDLGLFVLGRLFDQAMKLLLETARDSGAPVLEGHLKTLKGRIDWALGEGMFADKSTLQLLKNERNERGHEPPTREEREASLKFAPFLAGLYIDYLILIESRIQPYRQPIAGSCQNQSPELDATSPSSNLAALSGLGELPARALLSPEPRPGTPSAAKRETSSSPRRLKRLLSMTNREFGGLVCNMLRDSPNRSAKRDDLTPRLCKHLSLDLRGNLRAQFNQKALWALSHLKKKGLVKEYRAKNIRIRLI